MQSKLNELGFLNCNKLEIIEIRSLRGDFAFKTILLSF